MELLGTLLKILIVVGVSQGVVAYLILVERKIEFPRPRDLEVTYTKEFQDIVHELRGHIHQARQ